MRALASLVRLPRERRTLLVRAILWATAVRLALWALPFAWVRRIADSLARVGTVTRAPTRTYAAGVSWAMQRACLRIPFATCLTQALAARVMLGRAGFSSHLSIGVARGSGGELEAHAWLESGPWVIVGAGTAGRYTRLPLPQELPR